LAHVPADGTGDGGTARAAAVTREEIDSAVSAAVRIARSAWKDIGRALIKIGVEADTTAERVPGDPPRPAIEAAPAAARPAVSDIPLPAIAPPLFEQFTPKPTRTAHAQIALGLGWVSVVPDLGDFALKPWWKTEYCFTYREANSEKALSGGLGIDISLYTFNEGEYRSYYKDKEGYSSISINNAQPLLVADVGYYVKFYGTEAFKIPYISGSAGATIAVGGNGTVEYIDAEGKSKVRVGELVDDVYVMYASVGLGVDIPIPIPFAFFPKIKVYADIQYMLRLGLYSILIFDEGDMPKVGGLVSHVPLRFGVIVPFKSVVER
jgi:hypothetical protein